MRNKQFTLGVILSLSLIIVWLIGTIINFTLLIYDVIPEYKSQINIIFTFCYLLSIVFLTPYGVYLIIKSKKSNSKENTQERLDDNQNNKITNLENLLGYGRINKKFHGNFMIK